VERELGRGEGHQLLHLCRVQADVPGQAVDAGAGAAEGIQGPVPEDLHADLGQDAQGGPMDRLHLIGGQDLDRPERVDQPAPGKPPDPAADATWAAAWTLAAGVDRHGRMLRGGHGTMSRHRAADQLGARVDVRTAERDHGLSDISGTPP
jgi:hypothetical protein